MALLSKSARLHPVGHYRAQIMKMAVPTIVVEEQNNAGELEDVEQVADLPFGPWLVVAYRTEHGAVGTNMSCAMGPADELPLIAVSALGCTYDTLPWVEGPNGPEFDTDCLLGGWVDITVSHVVEHGCMVASASRWHGPNHPYRLHPQE